MAQLFAIRAGIKITVLIIHEVFDGEVCGRRAGRLKQRDMWSDLLFIDHPGKDFTGTISLAASVSAVR